MADLDEVYTEVDETLEQKMQRIEDAIRASQRNPVYPCEVVRDSKYSHYYKDSPYTKIDVYRVLELFDVRHPCLQHAIKKLLVCGTRGAKDQNQDIKEAIDSLVRWQQMKQEEHESNT